MDQRTNNTDALFRKKIFADQVNLLHKNLLVSIPANFVCAFVVFIGLHQTMNPIVSISWIVCVALISIFRFVASRFYYQKPAAVVFHFEIFMLGLILSALLWGIADSFLMPKNDLLSQMIVIVIIAGITAGGVQTLIASLTASITYVTLIVAPLCVWLLMQTGMTYLVLGIAMTTYLLFMLITCIRGYKLLEKTLSLQYENLLLVADLSASNKKIMQSYKLLEQHESDIVQINKLNDMLQTCKKTQDAYPMIAFVAKALFTNFNGAIVMKNADTGNYETVAQWGSDQSLCTLFESNYCWALRGGQIYTVSQPNSQLICDHFIKQPNAYICLPVTIQTKKVGLLILYTFETSAITRYQQQLATSYVEVVQLWLANIMLRETLYEKAIHDPLTGLFNRRYLDETIQDKLNQVIKEGRRYSIAMIDLDYFKTFNDANGHEAGDKMLLFLANMLKNNFQNNDIACRYGGEEFLIVMIDSDLSSANQQLERLRQTVKKKEMYINGKKLSHITISAGIAEAPTHGNTMNDIIQAADKALYAAKQGGRDRIECFDYSEIY